MTGTHENFKEAFYQAIKTRLNISIPKAIAAQREAMAGLVLGFFIVSGCRVGEVRALRWESVDLKTGRVKIIESFKSEKEIGLPKWNKTREISLPLSYLANLKEWKKTTYFNRPENFVFSQGGGENIGTGWVKKNFDRIIKRINEDDSSNFKTEGRQITPHVMRHSLNTNLLAAEVSPLLVQTVLGWSSEEQKILTRVQAGYTGLQLLRLETVSEAIEKIYFPKDKKQEAAQ